MGLDLLEICLEQTFPVRRNRTHKQEAAGEKRIEECFDGVGKIQE